MVNSTRDFYAIANRSCGVVELNCDIILNDETFDENGNPSGGDGVVYCWQSYENFTAIIGNGYTIKGLYIVDGTEGCFMGGACSTTSLDGTICDLVFENVYIGKKDGSFDKAGLFGWAHHKIENVILKSGTIRGNSVSAFCKVGGTGSVINCVNYANLYGTSYVSGIARSAKTSVINCVNYGNIYATNNVAGIVRDTGNGCLVKNCFNYGNISATSGIVGIGGVNSYVQFYNCSNLGTLSVTSGTVGGITCGGSYKVSLNNCSNYGKIVAGINNEYDRGCGELIGGGIIPNYGTNVAIDILIKNCNVYSVSGEPVLGRVQGNMNYDYIEKNLIRIENLTYQIYDDVTTVYNSNALICPLVWRGESEITLNNIKIIDKAHTNAKLFYTVDSNCLILKAKNIYIETDLSDISNLICKSSNLKNISFDDEMTSIIATDGTNGYYYGSTFSGFYYSWRTGKIGVIALDGRGQFQGSVDEEWLLKHKQYIKVA